MIRAVILDIGGVLIDVDIEKDCRMYRDVLGYDKIEELLDPCHQKGIYSDLEEGKVSADDFRNYILSGSRKGSTAEDVDKCVAGLLLPMPEYKADYVTELSRRYDIYILSNNNAISINFCHKIFENAGLDWKRVIRKEFLSFEMRMLKPSEEIYRTVIREIGLPAEEMLFADDSPANVNAAVSAGMNAVLYKPGENLKDVIGKKLEELG